MKDNFSMRQTYIGQYFKLHLFKEESNKICMGLASEYVYPPTNINELKNLINFINEFIENSKNDDN